MAHRCFSPVSIQRPKGNGPRDRMIVPCGKCPACDLNRVQDFKNRALYEFKNSDNAFFITLTYDDEKLPFDENLGVPTLVKKDYQTFLKKLRKEIDKEVDSLYEKDQKNGLKRKKMRYILCGEYGPQHQRPHYHAVLFNVPCPEEVNHLNYVINIVERAWGKGFIKCGYVEGGAIDYVVSYILGKRKHKYSNQAPFMEASRRPGIGYIYVEKMKEYYNEHPEESSMVISGGKKLRMPRYFKDKLFSENQRETHAEEKKLYAEREAQKFFAERCGGDPVKYLGYIELGKREAERILSRKEKSKSKLPRSSKFGLDGIV